MAFSVAPSFAEELESLIEREVELARAGRVAVFPVEIDGEDRLAVAIELVGGALRLVSAKELGGAVEAVVSTRLSQRVVLALCEANTLPAVAPGSSLRAACRAAWDAGELLPRAVYEAEQAGSGPVNCTETERRLDAIFRDVLGVSGVDRQLSFFALGGSSLKAAELLERVACELGVVLEPASLYDASSVAALARRVDAALKEGAESAPAPSKQIRGGRTPLSHGERRLWFLWRLDPTSSAYHVAGRARLSGELDPAALERALQALLARHEALRSRYLDDDGQAYRWIDAEPLHPVRLERVSAADELAVASQEAARPFDLAAGPLLRALLVNHGKDEHTLVLTVHHIACDADSLQILVRDLFELYRAERRGDAPRLPRLDYQYADFSAWQAERLTDARRAEGVAQARRALAAEAPELGVPVRSGPAAEEAAAHSWSFELPSHLTESVRAFARGHEVSTFLVLLAGWLLVLGRHSRSSTARVGVPATTRHAAHFSSTVGFFVNTLVLDAALDPQHGFEALLGSLRASWQHAQAQRELPFELLVEALAPERSLERQPLFEVLFNHLEQAAVAVPELAGLRIHGVERVPVTAQFPLALDTAEAGERIVATLGFDPQRFELTVVRSLAARYVRWLEAALARPALPLAQLDGLEASEVEQQLRGWNETARDYAEPRLVHELFEQQARRTPDAEAVVFGEQRLSYGELLQRVERLSSALVGRGVGPESLVGVHAERSLELVVALFAVLHAGGAYVPLEPEYPQERLAEMLTVSRPQLVLTQTHLRERLPEHAGLTFWLDGPHRLDASETSLRSPTPHADGLAYCIFTSGSTGKPKGVSNTHAGLRNRLLWMQERYSLTEGERVLQKTPFSFDVSVWEFFWPLMVGATLVVAPPGAHRDPSELAACMARERISVVHFVPTMLQAFIAAGELERVPSLRRVLCSGEALPSELAQTFRSRHGAELHNLYGPTEAAIDVSSWQCGAEPGPVPIGRPIANVSLHVLDTSLKLVPAGVVGELYIGGVALARGYQARPDLTAERFVPSPFVAGQRLYRTGDLARHRTGGALEYVGRADQQVKVRGFRIELSEIEARLRALDAVADAAVLVREDAPGEKRLVAYVVPRGARSEQELSASLRSQLAQVLPEYMVPSRFVALDHLPITTSGKLDRKALPVPAELAGSADFLAPREGRERELAEIWSEILRVERVGRRDNFFELGGDSISALQVVGKAKRRGIGLTPRDLFRHQTLEQLATAATEAQATPSTETVAGEVTLSPVQRWWLEGVTEQRDHYNQAVLLELPRALSERTLNAALAAVATHHDSLRLRLRREADGTIRQLYADAASVEPVWRQDLSREAEPSAALDALLRRAHTSLDLERGPLLRAVSVRLATEPAERLLLVVHHLAIDGVSWRILLEDLAAACQAVEAGREPEFGPATSSFQTFVRGLERHAKSEELRAELGYWSAVGAGVEPPSGPEPASATKQTARALELELDAEATTALLSEAGRSYRTRPEELMLTALARALGAEWGRERVLVELEGHGRDQRLDGIEVSRTLGWFTTRFPVALPSAPGSLRDSICGVKAQLRAVPGKGVGYGVLRYLHPAGVELAKAARPRVVFNYLGQFTSNWGDGWLRLAREASGPAYGSAQAELAWFELDALIRDGRLRTSVRYNANLHTPAEAQRLGERYLTELRAVIAHCLSPDSGALSAADFPLAQLEQSELDALPVPAREVEDIFPLSALQQGLLLHSLLEPSSGMYLMQDQYRFERALDPRAFGAAWQAVMDRHAALRASFLWRREGKMLQVIRRSLSCPFEYVDLSDLDEQAQRAQIDEALRAELERGFELDRAPLLAFRLFRLGDARYHFVKSYHHVLIDAWCRSLLWVEFFHAYQTSLGASLPPRAPAPRYRDFVAWLEERPHEATRRYFREALSGFEVATPLPLAPEPAREPMVTVDVVSRLGVEETHELSRAARELKLTVNTLAQAAWALVLSQYTGQQDLVFGVTVAGRPPALPGVEDTVGLFINSIPLRVRLPFDAKVGPWLTSLLEQNLAMREHEHLPLVDIQAESSLEAGQRLFETLFVFENAPLDASLAARQHELGVELVHARTHTNYPITVVVVPGAELTLQLSYDQRRFDRPAMERLLAQLQRSLLELSRRPEARLGELRTLSSEESSELSRWNQTAHAHPLERGYVALFQEQVARAPDRIVATHGGERLTYAQLSAQVASVAGGLANASVCDEALVGVLLERGLSWLTSFIAILAAGGAYLPLDVGHPARRSAELVRLGQLRVVLTARAHQPLAEALLAELAPHERPRLVYFEELSQAEPADVLAHFRDPRALAYALFTSGSTGVPKAALVEQRGMLNNQLAKLPYLGLTPDDVIAQTAGVGFDISVWQLLTAPLVGARVEIVPDSIARDASALLAHVQTSGITVLESVPALIQALLEEEPAELPQLRWLLPTGEALPADVARAWLERYPTVPLVNAYGPAECSDDVALARIVRPPSQTRVPIGTPTDNNRLYVLDGALRPLPVGVTGELYVAGVGVGRGYLRDPERTAASFIPSPFAASPGERLYRTGDRARRRTDGELEFVGRVDHQVKLRGHRIELGEIESRLRELADVAAAAVDIVEAERVGKRLVAFVVLRGAREGAAERLSAALGARLPDFMLPSRYVFLASLPLSQNGKLDRKRLPLNEAVSEVEHEPPRGDVERRVALVWQGLLGKDQIGRQANFFELGGHSLLATQMASRIKKQFDVELPLRALFDAPTLAAFARRVEQGGRQTSAPPAIVPVSRDGRLPLSFAQQRLWFLSKLEPNNSAYHLTEAARWKGRLDVSALARAFSRIVERHEALRTCFREEDGAPYQVILPAQEIVLGHLDERGVAPERRDERARELAEAEAAQPFDLENGPLLRVKVAELAADDHVVLVTAHHIVSDGWSMHLMVDEFTELYAAYTQGREPRLPELTVQYADFAVWQREWLEAGEMERQLGYWRRTLGEQHPVLALPTERPRPVVQSPRGSSVSFRIGATLTQRLRELALARGATLFALGLAALKVLLLRHTGQRDVRVGVPVASRTRLETEHLIGFFVNTQVLRTTIEGDPKFSALVDAVQSTSLDAQAHQDVPFERLVEALNPERSQGHHPLFQALFNHVRPEHRALAELPDAHITWTERGIHGTQFDLTVHSVDEGDTLNVTLVYRTDLFASSWMEALAERYQRLLGEVARDPEQSVTELVLVGTSERDALLSLAGGRRTNEAPRNVVARFEAQVARAPEHLAVVFGDEQLSYAELNRRANRLARRLRALGVSRDEVVGLHVERSLVMMVGLFGILKAGAAFLPLEVDYPRERLEYMQRDARPRVILTQSHLLARVGGSDGALWLCLDDASEALTEVDDGNLELVLRPEQAAYCIYTSGSTGRPKGTVNHHGGLDNRLRWGQAALSLQPGDRVLQKTPLGFDVSVWELFWALCEGATLVVARPGAHREPAELRETIVRHGVTVTHFVPSMLQAFVNAGELEACRSLRRVVCSGEALSAELVERFFARSSASLENLYGPTEASIEVSHWSCERERDGRPIPIGHPIANIDLHVLDERLNLVPLGVAGELYIGGVGVARGYANRPDLTAERFVPDPYRGDGHRLYRTGDWTRCRADGAIEYLGRRDEQVKIRGNRVELGEVETRLREQPGVKDGAAGAWRDASGEVWLVGYVVPAAGVTEDELRERLRGALRACLPDAMVPSLWVFLGELPRSANGKLARAALPPPVTSGARRAPVLPRNDVETALVRIWSEVLRVEQVGVQDDFFELGGHSLLAVQIVARLRQELGTEVAVQELFGATTIAALAEVVTRTRARQAPADVDAMAALLESLEERA